jgi:hypothetical protein
MIKDELELRASACRGLQEHLVSWCYFSSWVMSVSEPRAFTESSGHVVYRPSLQA